MGLIFVTGVCGAGKSAVRAELRLRGLAAVGTDEEQICAFHDETGRVAVPVEGEWRTPEWQQTHHWSMVPDRVDALARSARDETVFLCGTASNEYDFADRYGLVISLAIDEATLRERVTTRTDNDFGHLGHQLEAILSWRGPKQDNDMAMGAVAIDATRPLPAVVDEIVELAALRARSVS
jgi:hypothetical protein